MRPAAQRFAENWLDERVIAREIFSAKDLAVAMVRDGEAHGIRPEDFDDDEGRVFGMILMAIERPLP